jgi:hypothetical protein
MTSCVRSRASSLVSSRPTWVFAVARLSRNRSAISTLGRPRASRISTPDRLRGSDRSDSGRADDSASQMANSGGARKDVKLRGGLWAKTHALGLFPAQDEILFAQIESALSASL